MRFEYADAGVGGAACLVGAVTEHEVMPNIQSQKKIRQMRADTAVRPYAEDLRLITKFEYADAAWAERRVWRRPEA